ncbi:MAG: serine/threonine-protein phosphatase [Bryobacteraceae bacterium]|nr:serine/threonine-protein phosphatase [Bryobacteraceae bacterium]
MNDWLEWFPLLLWLPVAAAFLLLAAAAWLAPRTLRLRIAAGWRRQAPPARPRLRPLLAAGMALLAAALLFAASAGEELPVRLAAVAAGAIVSWIAADFSWRAARDAARRRSALQRDWKLRAGEARKELLRILEGGEEPAAVACRILHRHLGCSRVLFFAAAEAGFCCRASAPEPEVPGASWPEASALAGALRCPPAALPLVLARPDGSVRLPAAVRSASVLEEEARLAALGGSAAAPVWRGEALLGFFLVGGMPEGGRYGPHHLAFLEDFVRAYGLLAEAAPLAGELMRNAEQTARAEARRAAVQLALSLVQPPEPVELPDLEWAGAAENRGECRVWLDAAALPGRTGLFFAAELEAGFEEAAIRIVQLQALLRTRARAYHEDLAELAASTQRALEAPGARWPQVRLFLALYRSGTRRLRYVNAGFLPPFLFRRTMDGAEVLRLRHTGPPLASGNSLRCEEAEVEFAPGDLLLAVSSTVPAAANAEGEAWGEVRLIDSLDGWKPAPGRDLLARSVSAWESFLAPPAQRPPSLFLLLRPKA